MKCEVLLTDKGDEVYFRKGKTDRAFIILHNGFALYEDRDGKYRHAGSVRTGEEAYQWLMGKTPKNLISIYDDQGRIREARDG